jgi:predicted  nucleic acid-binding Zn-ribbon protein
MPNPVIEALKALQYVDKQIWDLDRRRADRPRALEGKRRELAAKEQALAAHVDQRKAAEKDADRANLDLKTVEEQLQKLEVARNTAKTNAEYQAFTNQIGDRKHEISKHEDVVLAAIARVEEAVARTGGFEAEVRRVQGELAALEAEVQKEVAYIDERIGELRATRQGKAGGIEAEALARYDQILQKRAGQALAGVIRGACQGCGGTLTPQEQNRLLKDSGIVYCRHCSRILFNDEG